MRLFLLALALSASVATAQTPSKANGHVLLTPSDLKWGPAPAALPPGAQVAVLDGNPSEPGLFTLRLKLPDGYKVPAHTHPTDENIVVVQGTFRAGMGDAYNDAGLHDFVAGSFIKWPKHMRHFVSAKGETIVQLYGNGPFVVNYVNPKDDPRKKTGTAN